MYTLYRVFKQDVKETSVIAKWLLVYVLIIVTHLQMTVPAKIQAPPPHPGYNTDTKSI